MSQAIEVFATLRPDTSGFANEARSSLMPKMTAVGKMLAGGLAVGVAGAAAVGKALYDVGRQFDDAFDTIRTGTGATGKAFEGLKDDFRAVAATVPAEMGNVSTAIADLNTRLGLTGPELQERSAQFLELSRITGSDLAGSIESVTRLFGDWGVTNERQAETLDMVFRASQATGASVDSLAQKAVQFGAPMRQMGFALDETIALFGSFEKEGVNAELVMGSLRIALGNFAREGVTDTKAAFTDLIDRIRTAGSEGEATGLAMEYFGARAGPDMAAAIREGRLSIDELVAQLAGSQETIMGVGEATQDAAEKWLVFKNNVALALEPAGQAVMDFAALLVEEHGPSIIESVGSIGTAFSDAFAKVRGETDDTNEKMDGWAVNVRENTGQASEDMDALAETVDNVIGWIADDLVRSIDDLSTWATNIKEDTGTVRAAWDDMVVKVRALNASVVADWESVKAAAGRWRDGLATVNSSVAEDFRSLGTSLSNTWTNTLQWFSDGIDMFRDEFVRWGRNIRTTVNNVVRWFADGIELFRTEIAGWIENVREAASKVGRFFSNLKTRVSTAMGNMLNAVKTKGGELIGFFRGLPGRIARAMGNLAETLLEKGKQLIGGFVQGIKDAIPGIGDAVGAAAGAARSAGTASRGPGGGGSAVAKAQIAAAGLPVRMTNSYRTPEHNRRVGGAANSLHMDRANPASDWVGPTWALDEFAARLAKTPHRELLWRVPNHAPGDNEHVHYAHMGGMVSANWPTLPGLKSDERPVIAQIGEKITPKGRGGDGAAAPITVLLNIDGQRFATATAPAMRNELRHLEVTYS